LSALLLQPERGVGTMTTPEKFNWSGKQSSLGPRVFPRMMAVFTW
jgi:hypothetical protein